MLNGTFKLQRVLNLKAKENLNSTGQNMNLKGLKHRKSANPKISHIIKFVPPHAVVVD